MYRPQHLYCTDHSICNVQTTATVLYRPQHLYCMYRPQHLYCTDHSTSSVWSIPSSADLVCPQGLWGVECKEVCMCSGRGTCHASSGVCNCTSGYIGGSCQQSTSARACSDHSSLLWVCIVGVSSRCTW